MTFRIGEKVVYPNQGVGTIENITTRPSGVQFERFYLLRLSYSTMTVMV
ncbi:MAG: CarD family transcriptional regulator, partial [Planctomycetota bacterium]